MGRQGQKLGDGLRGRIQEGEMVSWIRDVVVMEFIKFWLVLKEELNGFAMIYMVKREPPTWHCRIDGIFPPGELAILCQVEVGRVC